MFNAVFTRRKNTKKDLLFWFRGALKLTRLIGIYLNLTTCQVMSATA
jgi:hypothetical protein